MHSNNYENFVFFFNIYSHVCINVVAFKIVPDGFFRFTLLSEIGKSYTGVCLVNMDAGASLRHCFWPRTQEQATKCVIKTRLTLAAATDKGSNEYSMNYRTSGAFITT